MSQEEFMSSFHRPVQVFMSALVALLALSACSQAPTKEPSAAALMPNLADYTTVDTLSIQDAVAKVAGAGSLGAGQPELTAAIAGVSNLVACYQKAGAIEGRVYVQTTNPTNTGIVIIVNHNVLTDPNTFAQCALPKFSAAAAQPGKNQPPQPCTKAYTLDKDNNQYYIAYVATNQTVCAAFCSALQGCTP
jgi:hypothetical protein